VILYRLGYPRGSFIVLDEVHTALADDPNQGRGWPPQMLAEEVLARCERWNVRPHGTGDDARGLNNETLLEQLSRYGLHLVHPIKDRISGWVRLKQLMASARDDDPDLGLNTASAASQSRRTKSLGC
jgi:hypothetical protein